MTGGGSAGDCTQDLADVGPVLNHQATLATKPRSERFKVSKPWNREGHPEINKYPKKQSRNHEKPPNGEKQLEQEVGQRCPVKTE